MNQTISRRTFAPFIAFSLVILLAAVAGSPALADQNEASSGKIRVVATLPAYAWAAEEIGGDDVEVHSIARGNQDAHFVRPRPSYTVLLRKADLFISTGLDLELWVPTLLDAAGNRRILEGQPGYVAAWPGIDLLEIPTTLSRSEGDVHIYGNPHIHTGPLNMVAVARNVLAGLA
jgi:ABC-type Zn uptake system ZnuABC Zn-binding protein ZnuA